jgi:hypothetical protein
MGALVTAGRDLQMTGPILHFAEYSHSEGTAITRRMSIAVMLFLRAWAAEVFGDFGGRV